MAVFASTTLVSGRPLSELIGTEMPEEDWKALQQRVIQGGKNIIDLRGRSSFQSPAYVSICMIAAAMGGKPFTYPAGVYVDNAEFSHILMAMESEITKDGVTFKTVEGTPEEHAKLAESYKHLCTLRDEVIAMGIIPAVAEWHTLNPHLKYSPCGTSPEKPPRFRREARGFLRAAGPAGSVFVRRGCGEIGRAHV